MSKKYYDKVLAGSGTSQVKVKSVFGAKILSKYGWKEGDGLGSSMSGAKECVQVEKRSERVGIGAENRSSSATSEWDDWWSGAYDSVASRIAIKTVKNKSRSSSSESSLSDEEKAFRVKKNTKRVKRHIRTE